MKCGIYPGNTVRPNTSYLSHKHFCSAHCSLKTPRKLKTPIGKNLHLVSRKLLHSVVAIALLNSFCLKELLSPNLVYYTVMIQKIFILFYFNNEVKNSPKVALVFQRHCAISSQELSAAFWRILVTASISLAPGFWCRNKANVKKRTCGTWFRRLTKWHHPISYQGELLRWIWCRRVYFMWSRTGDNYYNKTKTTGEEFHVSTQNYTRILLNMNTDLSKPHCINPHSSQCTEVILSKIVCHFYNKIFYLLLCSLEFFIYPSFYHYKTPK